MAAPVYDEKKYRKGINTDYYTGAVKNYTAQQEQNRANQIKAAAAERDTALREAYINRMQNEKTLTKNLATAGIRGGATETSRLGLANTYGTARTAAQANYGQNVNTINQNIDANIADYRADMMSRAEEYRQNLAQSRWQADREAYENMVNRKASREENAKDRAAQKKENDRAYWNTFWTNYYSGFKKSDLTAALKTAQKSLKKAKKSGKSENITKAQQRIAGIRARLGVINNK